MVGTVVRRTIAVPGFVAVAALVGLVVAMLASVSRRLEFVLDALASGDLSAGFKTEFLLLHLPGLGPLTDSVDAIAVAVAAVVAGITAATLARVLLAGSESTSDFAGRDLGLAIGILGIATAALGPAMLAGIAGLVGANGVLAALPLGGLEGSLLAVPAMVLSTYWLADGLDGGEDDGGPTVPDDR